MALQVKHIQDHPSGRKSYRRAYPTHLRPYLGQTQLRVSIGHPGEPGFLQRYEKAAEEWSVQVSRAERKHAGTFDPLTPELIDYLSCSLKAEGLALDDEVRWTPRGTERKREARGRLRENVEEELGEAFELRALGDIAEILARWGVPAIEHAEALGFILDDSSPRFPEYAKAFHEAHIEVWQTILRRLDGEDAPTPSEPPLPQQSHLGAPLPLLATFEAYAAAKGISAGVRDEWGRYIRALIDFVGHDDAARLSREDVVRWRDHLLASPTRLGKARKAVTVKDKYITALRGTLGWAVDERKLRKNVAAEVKVSVPKSIRTRSPDFTMDEAKAILAASLHAPRGRLSAPYVRARRWIPWLCAYSGARVNEISQMRKEDVLEVDGIWVLNITPEAGTVKSREGRLAPIHSHIIEQGFLDMIAAQPEGPIFYDSARQRVKSESNRHFKKVGEKLAKWVREDVGVNDPAIKPNHGWRHFFKTIAADTGIEEKIADAIQGHAPATTGRKYGQVALKARAAAIASFPRFQLK